MLMLMLMLIFRALLLTYAFYTFAIVALVIYGTRPRWQEDVMRSRVPSKLAILAGVCVLVFQFQGGLDRAAAMLRIGFTGERNRALRDAIDRVDHGRSTPRDNDMLIMAWMMTKDFGYMRLLQFVAASKREMVSESASYAIDALVVQYPQWFKD